MFSSKILLDSVSPTGKRLTTFEITFPRVVLAEFNTHRALSRNSASSRAIPIETMLKRVSENPFIPRKWGKPAKGMGAKEYYDVNSSAHKILTEEYLEHLDNTIRFVKRNAEIGNKEDLNRLLEPFMWHTVIVTATEFDNFFALRTNSGADWKIQDIANLMYDDYHFGKCPDGLPTCEVLHAPVTTLVKTNDWHCPLIFPEDEQYIYQFFVEEFKEWQKWFKDADVNIILMEIRKRISAARCARISYLTHQGKRDLIKDIELFNKLTTSGHWSPLEHVATPYFERNSSAQFYKKDIYDDLPIGNFIGWKQLRKFFPNENITSFTKGFA